MATHWKIYPAADHPEVVSDGVSMDAHGNVIFVDVLKPGTGKDQGQTEIVGILLHTGFLAKKEL